MLSEDSQVTPASTLQTLLASQMLSSEQLELDTWVRSQLAASKL